MKKLTLAFMLGFIFLVSGCNDPLSKMLREYHYAPIVPVRELQFVGDIYNTKNLTGMPFVLMKQIFKTSSDKAKLNGFMKSLKNPVVLAGQSSSETFELKAETDIIGYVKAELNAGNVTHFKVSYGNCYEYIATETQVEDEIIPDIMKRLQKHSSGELEGKYIVWALLQASSVQYEFYDKNKAKVNIEPGSVLEKALKAKIGTEWNSDSQKNLSFSKPHFIGYRLYQIPGNEDDGSDKKSLKSAANNGGTDDSGKKPEAKKRVLKEVDPIDLRKIYFMEN